MRIGQGEDAHRLVPGRRLTLGGVYVPHDKGLAGHSDADVLVHAVCDALLGALGQGDLGTHFPSSDPKWEDASGELLVTAVLALLDAAGSSIENVDATVTAAEPPLAPYQEAMRKSLAALLRLDETRVNLKLKSGDGLGAIGRGEGIAAQAIVLLREGPSR